MGIKNDLQKKAYSMKEKNTLKNLTLIKNTQVKVLKCLHRNFNFLLLNAINSNTFYNLHYDYYDLITKFCPGSAKWNTPF